MGRKEGGLVRSHLNRGRPFGQQWERYSQRSQWERFFVFEKLRARILSMVLMIVFFSVAMSDSRILKLSFLNLPDELVSIKFSSASTAF